MFRRFFQVLELQDRVEKLERELRDAQLDFEELYDRCKRLLGRTVKERERMERSPETRSVDAVSAENGGGRLPQGGMLTEGQREIQQRILRRRGGL